MEIMIVVVAVLVLGAAAVASAGALGQMKSEPVRDTYAPALPADRAIAADDLRDVRFGVATRGYDMEEVDAVMARMARELDGRGRESAETGEVVTPEPAKDPQVEEIDARPLEPTRRTRTEPTVTEKASAWRGREKRPAGDAEAADEAEAWRPESR
ncbi:DivIVA domain-containing protein [Mariniluteicoccus flavus]